VGTVLASTILSRAATTLIDTTPTRWSDADKLIYLNDGQRQVVKFKPDSNVVLDTYQLIPGVKQQIPDGTNSFQDMAGDTLKEGLNLLDLIVNMGTDGETIGGAIDPVDFQELNAFDTDWQKATPGSEVKSFTLDERYPDYFFVYPPQPVMLWDKAASVFKSGTYSWGAVGSNTIADASKKLEITYVDSALGAAVDLKDSEDLNTDLTTGQEYKLTCKAKYTGGSAGVTLSVGELDVAQETSDALTTSELYYSIVFTATSETDMRFQLAGMGASNVVTIDDIVLSASPGFVELAYSALPDDISTDADVINISDQFQVPLYHYVLHRCYARDAALSPYNVARSVEYWNLFVTELDRLDLVKKVVSPNVRQPDPSPSLTT